MADFNRVRAGGLYRYNPVAIDRLNPACIQRDGNRGRMETIMDDEREDEFMDTMSEPTQSHAELLEMRKRFVTYLARLDEQIRRAAIKEEMDRVLTTDIDRTEIDWLEEHVAQVEGPLPETTYPSENALAHRDANADSTPLIGSTVTSNKPVGGEGVRSARYELYRLNTQAGGKLV